MAYSRNDTGGHGAQALIEFAIIVPVLLVIVLGLIEVGRGFVFGVAAQAGAREASRLSANARVNPGITTVITQSGTSSSDANIIQRLIDGSAPALAGCSVPSYTSRTPIVLSGCFTGAWTVSMNVAPNSHGSGASYASMALALASSDAPYLNGGTVEVTAATPTVSLLAGVSTGWPALRLYDIHVQGDASMVIL